MIKKLALVLVSSSVLVFSAHAASLANDNASNSPYQPGNMWPDASNGGTGFGNWSFAITGGGGRFIGNSGVGQDPSFGLFAGNMTDSSSANRNLIGTLASGQQFSLQLGADAVAAGGVVGLNLTDAGAPVFTFKFSGGGNFWQLNDGGSDFDTNIPFSSNTALTFAFTFNGGSSYTVNITDGVNTFNGSNTPFTAGNNISNITGIRLFSNQQGGGANLGFNNLAVVPEPTSLALLAGPGLLAAYFFIRRRRSA